VRRLLPVLLAGLLALLGVAALAIGVATRTVWLPDTSVTSTAAVRDAGPLAVTAPGVLELRDGPVQVTATGPDGTPVLLAIGREADVTAWVDGAAHGVLTGLTGEHQLAVKPVAGEPEAPNPTGSDLWVQAASGTGSATLTYGADEGRWLLLVAADGKAPAPTQLSMTWQREVSAPWSIPLIVIGALLLLAAAGTAAWFWWRGDLAPLPRRVAVFAPADRSDEEEQ
jgi:hypothetical protein